MPQNYFFFVLLLTITLLFFFRWDKKYSRRLNNPLLPKKKNCFLLAWIKFFRNRNCKQPHIAVNVKFNYLCCTLVINRHVSCLVLSEVGGKMLKNLPVGSRAPIYVPSSEAVAVDVDTTSRTDVRDASPPPRPPLPAGQQDIVTMPRVRFIILYLFYGFIIYIKKN